jgi:hypothetical protein
MLFCLVSCGKKVDYPKVNVTVKARQTTHNTLMIQVSFDRPIEKPFTVSFRVKFTDGAYSTGDIDNVPFNGCLLGNVFYDTGESFDRYKERTDGKDYKSAIWIMHIQSEQGYIFKY